MENWFRTFHEGDVVVIEDESKVRSLTANERNKRWVVVHVMEVCCCLAEETEYNKGGGYISLNVEKSNLYKVRGV